MAQIYGLRFEQQSDRLYIHFDVSDHFLKLETFVETSQRAKRIVDAIDQSFFQGNLDYELVVLAPGPGTFLTKLGLYVCGGVGAVLTFLNTDIGIAYVEGLTGQQPAHWARQIGRSHRESAGDVSDWIDEHSEKACQFSAKIVVEMTRGVLEKEKDELERLGMDLGSLPDAVEARNEFYEICIADSDIKGIGFTPADEFPIPRRSFPERAIKSSRKEKADDPLPWIVAIESIFVTSPNWDKDDQEARQWKGKDSVRRACFFIIEDEEFWLHVKKRDLSVEVLDNLKVQWAFQIEGGRIKNRRVLRVLEFNFERLADPLSAEAIRAILGQFSDAAVDRNLDLFF